MDGHESMFPRVDGSAFQFILNAILPALFSSNLIKLTEFSSLLNSSITAAAVDNSSSSNDDNDTSNYFLSRDFGKDCFSISSFMTFVMVSVTSFFCHSSIILLLGIIIGIIAYFSIAQLLLQVLWCGIFCNPIFYSGKFDTLGRPKSFHPGVTKYIYKRYLKYWQKISKTKNSICVEDRLDGVFHILS